MDAATRAIGKFYGMRGKGWTLVLGSLFSITALSYRDRQLDKTGAGQYVDAEGRVIKFDDQAPEARQESWKAWIRSWYEPHPLHFAGAVSALWVYQAYGTFTRLMVGRYADITYQLRRPDVLANKIVVLKYLGVGCAAVPMTFGALVCLVGLPTGIADERLHASQAGETRRSLFNAVEDVLPTASGPLAPLADFAKAMRPDWTPPSNPLEESVIVPRPLNVWQQRTDEQMRVLTGLGRG